MTPKQFSDLLSLARYERLYPIDRASRDSYSVLCAMGLVTQADIDSLGFAGYVLTDDGASTLEWAYRSVRRLSQVSSARPRGSPRPSK